jgi:Site-specific DNA methylase
MKTTGSIFTGGALFDVGATQAGYEPIWGIEKFDQIASVARLNDLPVTTADVLNVDFSTLRRPDHLHASPPCPNFSIAKTGAVETELDIAMATAVCRALVQFKPDTFTLENVVGYRNSRSFALITRALSDLGYWWDADNLNSADFGVPQTRIRLVVRASRGLLQGYPAPVKWNGWYQAIEDLIQSLPDTEFAPWQIARLPKEYKEFLIGQGTRSPALEPHEPAQSITANNNQSAIKAFIIGNGNSNFADARPGYGLRYEAEPAHTVITNEKGGTSPRAFVLSGGNSNRRTFDARVESQPHTTVTASMDRTPSRAFVLDGQANEGERLTVRQGENPIFTLSASGEKRPSRAYVGRVVKMTVQCLGRFQSVPDSYKGLTVKINGNGFPCLLAQKVLETL